MTPSSGGWTETTIFNFNTKNFKGGGPYSGVIIDSGGNLFGTTPGTAYELTLANGSWHEKILHYFCGTTCKEGINNYGQLAIDGAGNLYGAASEGGRGCNTPGCGTVWELTPVKAGGWKATILYNFEAAEDGSLPYGGITRDSSGHIFGTTAFGGGRYGYGTVFELAP